MNYNFYANADDKLKILEYIFKKTDLKIFDLSSDLTEEISEYKSVIEISNKFDLNHGDKFALTFQLWSPRHSGKPLFRRLEINSTRNSQSTFRYSTEGWGLIQLYFGGIKKNELYQSHIGHFNEKGALRYENINTYNGKVRDWNWIEINKTSRKLKHYIHNNLAVRKNGSFGILAGADLLVAEGISLR